MLCDGLRIALIGAIAGLALALALSRFLESFGFEVATTDPWVLAAATSMAIGVALLAILVPALRAGLADPIEALAAE